MARELGGLEPTKMRTIVSDLRNEDKRINEETEDDPECHQDAVGDSSWDDAVQIEEKTSETDGDIADVVDPENLSSIAGETVDEIGIDHEVNGQNMVDDHLNIVRTVLLLKSSDHGMEIIAKFKHVEFTEISHIRNVGEVLKGSSGVLTKNDWPPFLTGKNDKRNNRSSSVENQLPALTSKALHAALKLITVLLPGKNTTTNCSKNGINQKP